MDQRYQQCRAYINKHWKELLFSLPKDKGEHIGLPRKFVSPSAKDGKFENDQFYWDSYFIILGLIVSKKVALAKGMIENFVYLQDKIGIIPATNRRFHKRFSQPPFLSSMVAEVYSATQDKKWLGKMVGVIEREYMNYWMRAAGDDAHCVYEGLSRYCDSKSTHTYAEYESGWDLTSRFHNRCLDYLPVDLNALLYRYEKNLVHFYTILGKKSKTKEYMAYAKRRKGAMSKLMWNEKKGFFFDYNQRDFPAACCGSYATMVHYRA